MKLNSQNLPCFPEIVKSTKFPRFFWVSKVKNHANPCFTKAESAAQPCVKSSPYGTARNIPHKSSHAALKVVKFSGLAAAQHGQQHFNSTSITRPVSNESRGDLYSVGSNHVMPPSSHHVFLIGFDCVSYGWLARVP